MLLTADAYARMRFVGGATGDTGDAGSCLTEGSEGSENGKGIGKTSISSSVGFGEDSVSVSMKKIVCARDFARLCTLEEMVPRNTLL